MDHLVRRALLLDIILQLRRKEAKERLAQLMAPRSADHPDAGVLNDSCGYQRRLLLRAKKDHASRSKFSRDLLDQLGNRITVAARGEAIQLVDEEEVVHSSLRASTSGFILG